MRASRKLLKAVVPIRLRAYEQHWGKIKDEAELEDFVGGLPPTQERKKRGKQS